MQALKNAAYSGPKEKSPEFADARNGFNCRPKPQSPPSTRFGACAYGDQSPNAKLMVIFGDSHATMWAAALEGVAAKNGYRLRVFSLGLPRTGPRLRQARRRRLPGVPGVPRWGVFHHPGTSTELGSRHQRARAPGRW